eukprot:TRINITY_DN12327_c1_g2_i10.p1 TRINITY_DN12327_c1_g2~~TRINITY_DN12327_c1_g2_i10.p1  ORF type:complete len:1113 (+),score=259.59 TRINITY_DN12327_c1_g2_i10:1324-4662(+)
MARMAAAVLFIFCIVAECFEIKGRDGPVGDRLDVELTFNALFNNPGEVHPGKLEMKTASRTNLTVYINMTNTVSLSAEVALGDTATLDFTADTNSYKQVLVTSRGETSTQLDLKAILEVNTSTLSSIRGSVRVEDGTKSVTIDIPYWSTTLSKGNITVTPSMARLACEQDYMRAIGEDVRQKWFDATPALNSDVEVYEMVGILGEMFLAADRKEPLRPLLQGITDLTSTLEDMESADYFVMHNALWFTINTIIDSLDDFKSQQSIAGAIEICGNDMCNKLYESCSSCEADCGPCNTTVTVSQPGKIIDIVGAYNDALFQGSSRLTAYVDTAPANPVTVQAFNINEFTENTVNFTAGVLVPNGDCFGGLTFTYNASADLRDVRFEVDMTALLIFRDGIKTARARYYDADRAQWVPFKRQLYTFSTKFLTFTVPTPRQVAVYATEFEELNQLNRSLGAGATTGPTQLVDGFSNNIQQSIAGVIEDLSANINNGESLAVDLATVGVQAINFNESSVRGATATTGYASVPAARLPNDFDIGLSSGQAVDVVLTALKSGQPNSDGKQAASVVDLTLKANGNKVPVANLSSPIELEFFVNDETPSYQRVCQFWNASLVKTNCTDLLTQANVTTTLSNGTNVTNLEDVYPDGCYGDWDRRGLTKVEAKSVGTRVVCQTTHLSTFAVGVDFTISAPIVRLSNFNPLNAPKIWALWAGFYGFCGLILLYSWLERRTYDRQHAKIARGELEPDELGPRPKSPEELDLEFAAMGLFKGWLYRYGHAIKSKHQWLAVLWPRGKRVYPRRSVTVMALISSMSMAFGMMSIFAYTESQKPGENTNTFKLTINGDVVYMPMEGIYAFIITLPLTLALSVSLAKYSTFLTILRKANPEKYRKNKSTELVTHRGSSLHSLKSTASSSRSNQVVPISEGDVALEVEDVDGTLDLDQVAETSLRSGRSSISKPRPKSSSETDGSDLDGDKLAELDRKMVRYRTFAFSLAFGMIAAGFALALTFMGSASKNVQDRYLKGVGEFVLLSAIVTAPAVLLFGTGVRQWKMWRQRKEMTEEEWAQKLHHDRSSQENTYVPAYPQRLGRQRILSVLVASVPSAYPRSLAYPQRTLGR